MHAASSQLIAEVLAWFDVSVMGDDSEKTAILGDRVSSVLAA